MYVTRSHYQHIRKSPGMKRSEASVLCHVLCFQQTHVLADAALSYRVQSNALPGEKKKYCV